jgi:cytochrome c
MKVAGNRLFVTKSHFEAAATSVGFIGSQHFETESHSIGQDRKLPSRMMKTVSLAIVALAVSAGVAVAGDIAAGETVFKKCMTCHSKLGETAQNMIGPVLNGLKGRKSGSVPGFNYSDANKNSRIVWDEGTFKEYIKDPKAKIPGTKMAFAGIKNEKEIDDLWSFIELFGPDGKKK